MNNKFNFNRLMLLLKRDVIGNWKKHLSAFLGVFCGLMSMTYVFLYSASGDYLSRGELVQFNGYMSNIYGGYTIVLLLYMGFMASEIMEPNRTKEQRISYMMLPATLLEKFVSRAIMVMLFYPLLMLVAVFVTDLCRFLIMGFFELSDLFYQLTIDDYFSGLFQLKQMKYAITETEPLLFVINSIAWTMWLHSLLILGGNYFRKQPFIKTCGLFILANILGMSGLIAILSHFGTATSFHFSFLESMSISLTVAVLLIVFNWWLSFRLFSRTQVTKRRLWKL